MTPAVPRLGDAQATVQDLLTASGAYSPIELLLATNVLGYDDYRAWRRGERKTLDDALADAAGETRALVERVDSWARSLHLHSERIVFYGIDENAGTELVASASEELDMLLHTEYRPAADRRQRDIFLDTRETQAADDLVTALCARDAADARTQLDRLRLIDPHHWMLHDAATLIDALHSPAPSERQLALRRMETLERQWLPAVYAVLHTGARDFVTPLWRSIGAALDDNTRFDTAHPTHHPSSAYRNGLDWENVKRSVCREPDFRAQPHLLERLAEAEWRLRDRKAAIELWFALCWQAPDHFEETIGATGFPDASLKKAWQRLQDEDWDASTGAAWLPAWMVLEERGIARTFKPRGGTNDPERAFDLLLQLKTGGSDREDIDNRRALQNLHLGLFERYLDGVED